MVPKVHRLLLEHKQHFSLANRTDQSPPSKKKCANPCAVLARITHRVSVQREMFLNLIDPGASRTQLTVCTRPGPEPRVGSAPGAELCSEQFTASKLLKMATCLTSAESNNWDFFFFFYSAAERSSSRMLSRGKLACMNGMKGIMTWWDPFCGICKINI